MAKKKKETIAEEPIVEEKVMKENLNIVKTKKLVLLMK